jgi:membrane protease YdiL (CAAX protease family)
VALPYFAITFAISWGCWLVAAALGISAQQTAGALLLYAGGLGPPAAALALTYLDPTRAARRDYWARLIDPRRIGAPWWAAVVALPLAISWGGVWLSAATGDARSAVDLAARADLPLGRALAGAVLVLLFGPLPEEMGWRGYALDRLQENRGALRASIVLGAAWALWHVPLFLIPGTYQHARGFGSARFSLFLAALFPQSIVMTWIYNNTARSTLSAVLYHFMLNLSGEFTTRSTRASAIEVALAIAVSAAVVARFGARTLAREPARR